MTVTNHLLAGSVIALTVREPVLVLVLAYTSHFLMDALPHFGYPGATSFSDAVSKASKHKLSYVVSVFTAVSFIAILAVLIVNHQWFAVLAGLVAASPDGLIFLNYLLYERKGLQPKGPRIHQFLHLKFHGGIQQMERPWGVFVEIFVFVTLTTILFNLT